MPKCKSLYWIVDNADGDADGDVNGNTDIDADGC